MANVSCSSSSLLKRPRLGTQFQLELSFNSDDAKQAFLSRWDGAKHCLSSETSLPLGNKELLGLSMERLEAEPSKEGTATPSTESWAAHYGACPRLFR